MMNLKDAWRALTVEFLLRLTVPVGSNLKWSNPVCLKSITLFVRGHQCNNFWSLVRPNGTLGMIESIPVLVLAIHITKESPFM